MVPFEGFGEEAGALQCFKEESDFTELAGMRMTSAGQCGTRREADLNASAAADDWGNEW